jgi:hypothetical protein
MERIVERPGALDVHRASVTACVRVWQERELTEHVAEFQTTVAGLLALRDWLEALDVRQVAMEATGGPPPVSWSQVVVVVVAVRNRRLCTVFSRASAHVAARARPSGSPAAWSASNSAGERIPSVECSLVGL